MSKGRKVVSVRLSDEALAEITVCLYGQHVTTKDEPWCRSDLVRRALWEFVNHRRRGRKAHHISWEEFTATEE